MGWERGGRERGEEEGDVGKEEKTERGGETEDAELPDGEEDRGKDGAAAESFGKEENDGVEEKEDTEEKEADRDSPIAEDDEAEKAEASAVEERGAES